MEDKLKKKICIAQIGIENGNPEANAEKIAHIIRENSDADIIAFPELVLQGHRLGELPEGEIAGAIEKRPYSLINSLHDLALEMDTHVIFGEMDEIGGDIYNLAVYVGQKRIERYAKTHIHWTENFMPGDELKVFDSSIGPIGILICFDAAFVEASRVLALKGAETIVVIAAIPEGFDIEYEILRLKAMAHNNQLFVLFANRSGKGFNGNSAVFGPRGEIMGRLGKDEAILRVEIDLDDVRRWREEEQLYRNRRPELYKEIGE